MINCGPLSPKNDRFNCRHTARKIMDRKRISAGSLLLVLAAHFPSADAACFYPGSDRSGYKIPLNIEIRTADAIVIGRVLSERRLQEEADDPDGVTASNVSIKVLKNLKGTSSGVIVVRNENTSSRYPLEVGEEHILFVSRTNHEMWIDICGNSEVMPNGEQVVKKVRKQLQGVQ